MSSGMRPSTPTSKPTPASNGPAPISQEEAEELAFGQVWKDAGSKPQDTKHAAQRPSTVERRKSSVQFNTGPAEETIRRESVAAPHRQSVAQGAAANRNPSPPPPVPYSRGIAFDTFHTPDASAEAFSIQYKHNDFIYSPRTRTFICGTDAKDYSEYALEWTLDELVDDGDEIVCLRVVAEDSMERRHYREEAERLLESVVAKNAIERKAISLKMELAVGKVTDVIQSMIHLYEPVAIIVGTRGRALTGVQGLMSGSVSKYCLQRSPVPTIVVRPSSKRTKKKTKRQAEAGRSVYTKILSKAQSASSKHIGDKSIDVQGIGFETASQDQEASAVGKAVGPYKKGILKNRHYGGGLARVTSTSLDDSDDEPTPSFALPIGYLTMESAPTADTALKDPMIQALAEWDESPQGGSRNPSPAPKQRPRGRTSNPEADENAVDDEEADFEEFGKPKIIDQRRPSTRSQNAWLNSILSRPEPKEKRPASRDRGSRSRSR